MQLKMDTTRDDLCLQRTLSVSSSTQTSDADIQPSPQPTSPFSPSPKSIAPFPLVAFTRPKSDVVRQGYLGRQERSHLQYYVLRSGSHTGPSRLEWYEKRETFVGTQSEGGAVLFGSSKQGMIYLSSCLCVSRMGSEKTGRMVVLYTKELKLILAMEDMYEQNDWYLSIKRVMEQDQKKEEEKKKAQQQQMLKVDKVEIEMGEEEVDDDEGYWTLPPAAFFKEVWAVTVKPTSLGCCESLAGESRLCLTASSLLLVRLNTSSYSPPVDFPLLSIRRFGHTAGSLYLELGRSAPHGPGEIWMELKDKGNAAQRIHEKIRVAVRELRALPDFGRSPPCGGQKQRAFKGYRHKHREKPSNPKSLHPRLSLTPKSPDASCTPSLQSSTSSRTLSCSSQTSEDYMEMWTVRAPARERERWETGKDQSAYMVMSPQPRSSLPVSLAEDYTAMESRDEEWSGGPSNCTSMNSVPCGCASQCSTATCLTTSQSEISSSCVSLRQWFTFRRRNCSHPASDVGSQAVTTTLDLASSTSSTGCFNRQQDAPDNPVRRSALSFFCLPLSLWGWKK